MGDEFGSVPHSEFAVDAGERVFVEWSAHGLDVGQHLCFAVRREDRRRFTATFGLPYPQ